MSRLPWLASAAILALLGSVAAQRVQAQTPPAPSAAGTGFATLQGFIIDSIHGGPLASAVVIVEGTGRNGMTNAEGRYRVDSVPAGPHRVLVMHPVLDTLGIQMRTPAYTFAGGKSEELDLAVPSGEKVASVLCTAAWRDRFGPAVMVGFVRDPDSNGPAVGAKVEVVYTGTDIIGRKQPPTKRTADTDSTGLYHICGLPKDMSGKVQVFRNGVSSGEVPVEISHMIALRAFSVASHQTVAEVKNDSGRMQRVATGTARLTGRITDKLGKPLEGARVALQGGVKVVVTRPNGEFTLDSLPSGTQAIVVRKLGYGVTEAAVELSANTPARTEVKMNDYVPVLATMRVEAAQDKALSKVGYLERKQTGMGRYYDGNQINHDALSFSDVMRIDPGLKVQPLGDGRTYVITDARSAQGGCVNFYVDGTLYPTLTPGDIDDIVRPNELVAIEVYHGAGTPPQFQPPGQSGCAAVVAWTVARVRPDNKKP